MRKFLIRISPLLIGVVFLLSAFVQSGVAHAAPKRPSTLTCTGYGGNVPCFAQSWWIGSNPVFGAATTLSVVTLPAATNATASTNLETSAYTTNDVDVNVGYATGMNNNQPGCNNPNVLMYVIHILDALQTTTLVEHCWPVPSGDMFGTVDLQINYCVSCSSGGKSGGVQMWINHTSTGDAPCNPCTYVNGRTNNKFNAILLDHEVTAPVTGQTVQRFDWVGNKWLCAVGCTGGWFYQTNGVTGSKTFNPTQQQWIIVPGPGGTGGDDYMCDYETGTTC